LASGRSNKDSLTGGPGNDRLHGGGGANTFDAGAGDDVIVLTSNADKIDGGAGVDTVRLAHTVQKLDAATLNASSIEVLDLRNWAKSTLSLRPSDVIRLSGGQRMTVLAETADKLNLPGVSLKHAQGRTRTYTGSGVTLTVTTDIPGAH
jgi:hypothetical protein